MCFCICTKICLLLHHLIYLIVAIYGYIHWKKYICINATRCAHVHTDKYSLENLNKVATECETHNIKLLFVAMCFPS